MSNFNSKYGKTALVIFLLFTSVIMCKAQSVPVANNNELSLNISRLIVSLNGASLSNISNMPYGALYKRTFNNGSLAWRIAGGYIVKKKNEEISFGNRQLSESIGSLATGIEKRKKINDQFTFLYGIDLRYTLYKESSTASSFSSFPVTIKGSEYGPGGGLVYGMMWNIKPRIALYTEGYLYANYITKNRYMLNPSKQQLEQNTTFSFMPTSPVSIYLLIKF